MIFEDADCAFCLVASVYLGWDELEVAPVAGDEVFEEGGCFVVKALELRSEATRSESGVDPFVGCYVFGCGTRFHWLGKNHVAVVVIDDKDVGVAGAGRKDESTSEIGCETAGDRFTSCEDKMGTRGVRWHVGWWNDGRV